MLIQNAKVLNSDTLEFTQRPLYIHQGLFSDSPDANQQILDATGLYAIPGFIDTHIHGFFGCDFGTPGSDLTPARLTLARQGTTGFAATVSTRPMAQLLDTARWLREQMDLPAEGAKLLGIHSEGPFISEKRKGAMIPTGETCKEESVSSLLQAADGALKLMTIAPERENAPQIIAMLKDRLTFSLGHTDATYQEALTAIDAGAVRTTHTFNGMRPLYHRETGILGAALTDERVHCEMIGDFVHLDPPVVKLLLHTKGFRNITLISDTGYMGGLPDGEYRGRIVKDGVARTKAGVICGSCYSMLRGAQNLLSIGVPLEKISIMASRNPAKALGLENELGSIAPGYRADLILCDEKLNIHAVLIDGNLIK